MIDYDYNHNFPKRNFCLKKKVGNDGIPGLPTLINSPLTRDRVLLLRYLNNFSQRDTIRNSGYLAF
jgi:hypothetical protein